ncbi:MAG TPA: hypothetical protein VEW91_08395 [bacterium]|nr:hypothetical protein [bacterium]
MGSRARAALVTLLCAAAFAMPSGAASAETLADALRTRGLAASPQVLPNLDKPITSYAVFEDGHEFLIAYYVDDGTGLLHAPLFVNRYDKVARAWTSAEIDGRAAQFSDTWCLGSAVDVRASTHAFYLGTHLNPSAGCTIVLSRDLAVQAVLPGWVLAVFGDGTIVYQRSEVHFAPTHYAELSLYDQTHRRDVQIYPMKPYQRIRTEHINRVRQVYSNEAWCRAHNHHCDPELFDNFLVGEVAISDATRALAFQVAFDNTVYWSDVERWRLEGFRSLRRYMLETGLQGPLSDALFMYLYEDLRSAERFPGRAHMLQTLEADREVLALVAEASLKERRPDQNWRAFFDALDPRWERPEIWARLATAIAVPPEFTEVAYVYRNVANGLPIEYREMLLTDLRTRFGRFPLQRYLDPDMLRRIFGD